MCAFNLEYLCKQFHLFQRQLFSWQRNINSVIFAHGIQVCFVFVCVFFVLFCSCCVLGLFFFFFLNTHDYTHTNITQQIDPTGTTQRFGKQNNTAFFLSEPLNPVITGKLNLDMLTMLTRALQKTILL